MRNQADLGLWVSGSHFTSNNREMPQGWHLQIEDALSGTVLADIHFTPEQFYSLMRSGNVEVEGRVSSTLDRVGKKMRWWQVSVPDEIDRYNAPEDVIEAWARENAGEPYDTMEIRRTNAGRRVIYRVWEPANNGDKED